MKSPQENPEKNAPSPNRKVAEDMMAENWWSDESDADWRKTMTDAITQALDAKDAEAREKVERVVAAVDSAAYTDNPYADMNPCVFAARSAAANEMREGKE